MRSGRRLDPKLAHAHYIRGQAHTNLKKYDVAIADFTRRSSSIQLPSRLQRSRRGLYSQEDWEKAAADFNDCLRVNPGYGIAYSNLGSIT